MVAETLITRLFAFLVGGGNEVISIDAKVLEGIQSKILQEYDYTPTAREYFTATAFTFKNARFLRTAKCAIEWFGGEGVESSKYLAHLQKNFQIPHWSKDAKVAPDLFGTEKRFKSATQISWKKSKLAIRFSDALDHLGEATYLKDSPQQGGVEVLVGTWVLSDGTPFPLIGEAWKDDASGKEFVYWHFDALVHTRHFHLKPHPSIQFILPYLFQSAGFLSESTDPDSQAITPTRQELFAAKSKADTPQLAFHHVKNHYHLSIAIDDDEIENYSYSWAPEVIRYGYIFTQADDLDQFAMAISVATAAMPKVADILVDGFANCRAKNNDNFQAACFADSVIYSPRALAHYEQGHFVAGPISDFIDLESFAIYGSCEQVIYEALMARDGDALRLALNGYQEVMSKGSGLVLPHAMNSYVYMMQNHGGAVLGLSQDERDDFHDYGAKILKYVTTLPVDLQDANAYSNLALLEIARRRYKEALEAVNAGITILREDRTHIPDSPIGNSRPTENPWIKLELFATRAELLYRANEKAKAKDLAAKVLEEALSLEYDGPEVKKVKWILDQK